MLKEELPTGVSKTGMPTRKGVTRGSQVGTGTAGGKSALPLLTHQLALTSRSLELATLPALSFHTASS